MGLRINQNIAAQNAYRNLSVTDNQMSKSLEKLSSGFRINRASDDAAGLSISEGLRAQTGGLKVAVRNAQDAISVVQTAEGALNETTNLLTRLRELAMQSASDGIGDTERGYIQDESDALVAELERIAQATEYNGTSLLNGAVTLSFQVGIRNVAANDRIDVSTVDATTGTLGVDALDLSTAGGAQAALTDIDDALADVSAARATFGSVGNRLNSVVATIQTAAENLSAANSRIRDVDVAEETSKMSRSQVLLQAGVSVLAQANQMPQIALKLLQ